MHGLLDEAPFLLLVERSHQQAGPLHISATIRFVETLYWRCLLAA